MGCSLVIHNFRDLGKLKKIDLSRNWALHKTYLLNSEQVLEAQLDFERVLSKQGYQVPTESCQKGQVKLA